MRLKNSAAVTVGFDLPDCLDSRSFEAKIKSSDTCE
jgi:hypothetical protein